MWLSNAWTAIDSLSVIWKSDLIDKIKCSFFQAVVMSIMLYGPTSWTLTKRTEKKLDGNYTRMLRTKLKKSWKQHLTKQQLYGHLPPITKNTQVRWTIHVGHCWRSKDELISDLLLWTPSHGRAKADNQQEPIYNSCVPIQDIALKTYRKQWTIERGGKRGSYHVLAVWYDDDDDDDDISFKNIHKIEGHRNMPYVEHYISLKKLS